MYARPLFLSRSVLALLAGAPLFVACTSSSQGQPSPGTSGNGDGTDSGVTQSPLAPPDKLDVLFMIDNSASMGDKQTILANTASSLLDRFVNPRCIGADGTVFGPSQSGQCAQGSPEFPSIRDIHVGVVTSSLGGRGGDVCPASATNPVNPALPSHNDDRGHLVTRAGADEHAEADAPSGFLAWFPSDGNAGKTPPPSAVTDLQKLAADFEDEVNGVNQYGCGFEAQLESWYRFLVQPDPYDTLVQDPSTGRVTLQGVDATLLKQRHDFLRPDSLVAVILITDENDSTVDPLALGGQGWAFENSNFPNSTTGGGAPTGTSACATNPNDPSCTSCGFCVPGTGSLVCDDAACKSDTQGYYSPADDQLNLRFFHMKQRFGIDPQFPVARYVTGLTSAQVPDRQGEHPSVAGGGSSANYVGTANCTNPLFAKDLPTNASGDLCNLTLSGRTPGMVLFEVIGGVPWQLVAQDPTSPASPDKTTLTDAEWTSILGRDPLNYDFTGADAHMLESSSPRAGLPPPSASDTADPIIGRDWDTAKSNLEYACVFDLPAPRDCTLEANKNACDCDGVRATPLCDPHTKTTQLRGRAFPTIRELAVARALGSQGIVSSICPRPHPQLNTVQTYAPAVDSLATRLHEFYLTTRN